MRNADNQPEIFSLQLQIKIKKQVFDEAIRSEKELEQYIETSQKQFN